MTSTKSQEIQAVQELEQDMFASSEYIDPNARLPRIQALRGENGANECGYFIPVGEMAKAGWKDFDEKQLIKYEFNSGGTEDGVLIQSPRMLVVPRSPLFAFDRTQSKQEEKMIIAGEYDKNIHGANKEQFGTARFYEVMLLDANNQPLHEIAFAYIAKGANLATFSEHWQQLVMEVTRCHAIANKIPARPKDSRFNALCVFQFTVKRELAGDKAKSPACKVDSHVSPTQANWEQFFLGRKAETANYFLELLQPKQPLALPTRSLLELPPSEAEQQPVEGTILPEEYEGLF